MFTKNACYHHDNDGPECLTLQKHPFALTSVFQKATVKVSSCFSTLQACQRVSFSTSNPICRSCVWYGWRGVNEIMLEGEVCVKLSISWAIHTWWVAHVKWWCTHDVSVFDVGWFRNSVDVHRSADRFKSITHLFKKTVYFSSLHSGWGKFTETSQPHYDFDFSLSIPAKA